MLQVQLSLSKWTQHHVYFGTGLDGFQQECVIMGKGQGSTEEEGQILVSQTFESSRA